MKLKIVKIDEGLLRRNHLIDKYKMDVWPLMSEVLDISKLIEQNYGYGNIPNNIDPAEERKLERHVKKAVDINMDTEYLSKHLGSFLDDENITREKIQRQNMEIQKSIEQLNGSLKYLKSLARYFKSKKYLNMDDPGTSEMVTKYGI